MKWYKPVVVVLCAVVIEIVLINHMFCLAVILPQNNLVIDAFTDEIIELEDSAWICNSVISVHSGSDEGSQYSVTYMDEQGQITGQKSGTVHSGIIKIFPVCRAKKLIVSNNNTDVIKEITIEVNRTFPVFSISRMIAMVIIYYAGVALFSLQMMPDYKKYMKNWEA